MGNENKVISHRFQMFCLLKITLHRAYLEILLIIWSALFGHLGLDFFSPIGRFWFRFVCVKPRIRETDFRLRHAYFFFTSDNKNSEGKFYISSFLMHFICVYKVRYYILIVTPLIPLPHSFMCQ